MQGKKVLPQQFDNKTDKIKHEMHQADVDQEMREMQAKGEGGDFKGNMQINLLDKLQEQKQAFKGDFSKIDDEIRIQVIALNKGDLDTVKRLRN